jgi:CzcA family heavy metal efflux pump
MMRSIIAASLRNKVLVLALAAGLVLFGAVQVRQTPVDVLPEFSPTRVEIQTEALGLSATEVEQLITVPLEADLLNGVPFLDELRSKSMPGLSSIELIFEPGTDLLAARQVVQEQMTQAHALPNVSRPPAMLQPVSSTSRVMMAGLSSDDLSVIEMSVLARWRIRPRLMAVPGVANVAIWGQQDRQLQVLVDPQRLRAQDVTLLDIISTTGNALAVSPLTFLEASTPGTGGFIDTPNQRLGIQHALPIVTAQDLSRVTVEGKSNAGLRLGDVTQVVEGHQPLIGDAVVHDRPGLVLVIEKFPNANTLEVTRELEAAFEEMAPGLTGIDIDTTIYRPATYIEASTDNLTTALVIGFLLLALILGLFLYQWRVALISLVTIPISILAASTVLYLRGVTFNTMMLAGLVIGLIVIVDDAVVDVYSIMRRLREERAAGSDKSSVSIIHEAASGVRSSIAFATLIVLVASAPLLFVGGMPGEFLQPVVFSFALAIAVSMVVAVTVTPVLALVLLGKASVGRRETSLLRSVQARYAALLARVVHRPRAAYLAFGATLLVVLAVLPFLGASLAPPFRESQLLVRWDGAPGTSEPEMQRITTRASRELRSIPGVSNVGAHIGRALLSDEVVNVNSGELWVSVDPEADYDATVASVREVVEGYPGVSGSVQTYLTRRVEEPATPQPDQDVVVRVFGPDIDVLGAKAAEVERILAAIDGVVDESVQLPVQEPSVQVQVDLAEAALHGIKPGDVRRSAGTYINGLEVGSIYEQQKVFEVVVRGAPQVRDSVTSVENLLLDTPRGGHVRLGDVASVSVEPAPTVIEHVDVSRSIDVTANVSGRDLGSVLGQVRADLQQVDFPLEYHAEVLDASAGRQSQHQHLLLVGLAALIGGFLLLQACFASWRRATLLLLALPMALAGGLLAALIAGNTLTIGAFAGFFGVLAVATRHGIMLVRRFQQLERDEGQPLGPALVLRGAEERLAPTLITTLAVGLALLPIVVAGDEPGFEVLRPLALVVLGGLVTSALLNLFVVPAVYLRFAVPTPDVRATSQPRSAATQ